MFSLLWVVLDDLDVGPDVPPVIERGVGRHDGRGRRQSCQLAAQELAAAGLEVEALVGAGLKRGNAK